MRISSPQFLNPCYYGTDIDSRENLISCKHPPEEVARIIGADSLGFLDPDDLDSICPGVGLCKACFTGEYPTSVPEHTEKDRFEHRLSETKRESKI